MSLLDKSLKLPDSWIEAELADIGKIVSGGTPSTKEPAFWGGHISWISPADLTGYNSKYISKGNKSITAEGLMNSSATIMPAGSIHFSSRAPIGYTVISSCDMTTNQGFKSLVPANGIFNEYVYYFLKGAKQLAESKATGTTFKEISGTAFGKLPIPVPPTNEQHRIVAKIEALFSELDKGIESFKTAREQLKIYRQALLKHAFSGKLTEQWRAENAEKLESADALLQRIQTERQQRYQQRLKDWEARSKSPPAPLLQRGEQAANQHAGADPTTVPPFEKGGLGGISKPKAPKTLPPLTAEELAGLPELPKGWIWHRLGLSSCSVEYGTSAKSSAFGACPVLRMGNIQNGKFDWADLVFTSDQAEIDKYLLRKKDVLFNRTNSPELVGKTAIYKAEMPAIFAGYLIRINQIDTIVVAEYMNYFLNSHTAKQHGNKVKTDGVNQSNINGEKLINYPFPFCSIDEQLVIIELLESGLSKIDQLNQTITTALQQAEALRQSILKKAFSGQLVPQDPNDEPAGVLLERIRAEKGQADKQPARRRGVISPPQSGGLDGY